MKPIRKIFIPLLPLLLPLLLIFFTNTAVNRHRHQWRGMLVEHAHPYKIPLTGNQHQHSDNEYLLYDLLSLDKVDDNVLNQPEIVFSLVITGNTPLFIPVATQHPELTGQRLRAPPAN